MTDRSPRALTMVRVVLVALVVVWLFSDLLRAWLPFWIPLVALAGLELEVVLAARRDRRAEAVAPASPRTRVGPGAEDADLGWGSVVEDESGIRWEPPPPRPRASRSRRALTVASIAAAAMLVFVGVRQDARASWSSLSAETRGTTEARLQREAERIAGRPVSLRCDADYTFTGARSDALGIAFPDRRLAFLEPAICRSLHDVLAGDARTSADTTEAIVVLAHEAVHLRGERREGVTECLALQEGVALAQRLGISRARAERMMRGAYLEALADRSVIRIAYQLPRGCRDGGALDEHPSSSTFP